MKRTINKYLTEVKSVGKKGFFHLLSVQGLIIIVGFASQFFVAGFLQPIDMGRIKIMQTYLSLASLLCGLGFNTSLLKLASENITVSYKKELYQTAFIVTLLSFLLIYTLLVVASISGIISADTEIGKIFPVYAIFLLPVSIQSIQLSYYQARKEIKQMAKIQFVLKTITVLVIVLATALFSLNGYVFAVIITGFLAIFVFESGIKSLHFEMKSLKPDFILIKKMWSLAGFALMANIVGTIVSTLDIYIINYFVTDRTEVGFYLFAVTIVSVYQVLPTSIQQIAFPFFSEQSKDNLKWYNSYKKYNKINHILVISMVTLGLIFFPLIIKFAFQGKYDRSIYYFLFLSLAWGIKTANIIKGTAIMGYGRFDLNFYSSVISLLITLPIVYFLIKYFTLNGAIIAMMLSALISYLTATFVFKWFKMKFSNEF